MQLTRDTIAAGVSYTCTYCVRPRDNDVQTKK
jgi:hypothetical protein